MKCVLLTLPRIHSIWVWSKLYSNGWQCFFCLVALIQQNRPTLSPMKMTAYLLLLLCYCCLFFQQYWFFLEISLLLTRILRVYCLFSCHFYSKQNVFSKYPLFAIKYTSRWWLRSYIIGCLFGIMPLVNHYSLMTVVRWSLLCKIESFLLNHQNLFEEIM